MKIIKYDKENYNLYSLVVNENGRTFVAPVLFTGEKWRLIAITKMNLKKYGFSRFLVPKGKGIVENLDIYINNDWHIC